ncbi:hypothetical protein GCM10010278_85090 [Streptomyces melanogenes]|nr:hypothetical protein GCM10010278_85090 [Streptomyces melanogenes]
MRTVAVDGANGSVVAAEGAAVEGRSGVVMTAILAHTRRLDVVAHTHTRSEYVLKSPRPSRCTRWNGFSRKPRRYGEL